MDERLRETLSAMMDDEADELSVRRLLSQADQDGVRSQWRRWQEIRDLMHDNHGPAAGMDIAGAVRERLDNQRDVQPQPAAGTGRDVKAVSWHWPVAAMVTLALVIGFGAGTGWDARNSQPLATSTVPAGAQQNAALLPTGTDELALQGLDEEQRRQMRQFLLEHAQHNSVGVGRGSVGYARLVSASDGY